MSSELQKITNARANTKAAVFSQTGDRNTQIAYANVINIILPVAPQSMAGAVINTSLTLSTEYYNLFVIGNETFSDRHFAVPKELALTESITPEIAAQFASLSENAIAQIKTFPSLFASENYFYASTSVGHQAFFGLVTDVKIQDNGIKIYFQILSPVPQQKLNEMAFALALQSASSFNELNRTHWTIKKVNLLEKLTAAGIKVLAA